jgi:hypothetical protein
VGGLGCSRRGSSCSSSPGVCHPAAGGQASPEGACWSRCRWRPVGGVPAHTAARGVQVQGSGLHASRTCCLAQVLEPQASKVPAGWEGRGSEIGQLELFDDDDQPLPSNVMYKGTSGGEPATLPHCSALEGLAPMLRAFLAARWSRSRHTGWLGFAQRLHRLTLHGRGPAVAPRSHSPHLLGAARNATCAHPALTPLVCPALAPADYWPQDGTGISKEEQ